MKKLFSMVLVFLFVFALSACTEEPEEPNVEDPTNEVGQMEVTIEIGEESFTHSLSEEFEGSLFDLIDQEYELTYSESEYGVYMLSLESLSPKNGAYIAIYENGEMAMSGVDQLLLEDGDVFAFDVVWYDLLLEEIDLAISMFLDNYVTDYISDEYVDVNVASALRILGLDDRYLGDLDVSSMPMFDIDTLETTAGYFKAVTIGSMLGEDVTSYVDAYAEMASVGPYGETAYGLMVLEQSAEYQNLLETFENDLKIHTPYSLGLDAGGVSLVALSTRDFAEKQALIDEFVAWIQDAQLDTGGVKTRDMTWGEATYPGTENAASMAQVIIGLLANGIDPSSEDFMVGENTLMSRFMEFHTNDGSFDYVLDDDMDNDLMFSTPQAFLAIVMFQEFQATYEGVHPYIID